MLLRIRSSHFFCIDPLDIDFRIVGIPGMLQCFSHRQVCVLQFHIFSDKRDFSRFFETLNFFNQRFPVGHVSLRQIGQAKIIADDLVHVLFLEHQRNFVQCLYVTGFDDRFGFHITEGGQFVFDVLRQWHFCTHYQNIRLDTQTTQFFDTVLRRLCFQFASCTQVRNQGRVDVQYIFSADFHTHLTQRFQERQRFDIPNGSSDFGDDDVRICCFAGTHNFFFDFIRDMRDDLDSCP